MKLQDYIHYYFGCQFTGKGNKYTMVRIDDLIRGERERAVSTVWNEFKVEDIKPILRRLESLTREEMKEIWQLIFSRTFPDSGNILWFDKETTTSCKRWVMMSGVERVGIELNGNVWADSDLSHQKFNPNIITHYLLTKHFDLFGLIDAGLAVDAKTVNA